MGDIPYAILKISIARVLDRWSVVVPALKVYFVTTSCWIVHVQSNNILYNHARLIEQVYDFLCTRMDRQNIESLSCAFRLLDFVCQRVCTINHILVQ